jgi:hypothetical protein
VSSWDGGVFWSLGLRGRTSWVITQRYIGHHTSCNVDTLRSENKQTFDLPTHPLKMKEKCKNIYMDTKKQLFFPSPFSLENKTKHLPRKKITISTKDFSIATFKAILPFKFQLLCIPSLGRSSCFFFQSPLTVRFSVFSRLKLTLPNIKVTLVGKQVHNRASTRSNLGNMMCKKRTKEK